MLDKEGSLNEQKDENLDVDWLVERYDGGMTDQESTRGNLSEKRSVKRQKMGTTCDQYASKVENLPEIKDRVTDAVVKR